jgi:hypothetical protein
VTYNDAVKTTFSEALAKRSLAIKVVTKTEWYF